jgi:alpha-D-xyloside xylohydrolase
MLGDSLLVAPVFSADGWVEYYLPEGRWTHLLTGEARTGPRWYREHHGFLSLPVFARPGAVLPIGAVDDRPDYDFAAGVTLRCHEIEDGAVVAVALPALDGSTAATIVVTRRGPRLEARWEGPTRPGWNLQLVHHHAVTPLESASACPDPLGAIVRPAPGASTVTVALESTP